MPDDIAVGDRPARPNRRRERQKSLDLRVRKRTVAEFVAGIDQLDPHRAAIHVALSLPERDAGVMGAPRLRHEAEDAAVLIDHIVRGHLGDRIAQARQRGFGGLHARVMDNQDVRRAGSPVEVGRGGVDNPRRISVADGLVQSHTSHKR
jgi:hypothetical protein